MNIPCPFCKKEHDHKFNGPGRYNPRCPYCQKRFTALVPEKPGEPVRIQLAKSQLAAAGKTQGPKKIPRKVMREPFLWRRAKKLNLILGSRTRLIVGIILLAGCLGWAAQNWAVSYEEEENTSAIATIEKDPEAARKAIAGAVEKSSEKSNIIKRTANKVAIESKSEEGTRPLSLPLVPAGITALLFASFAPGLAGLLLIVTSPYPGPKIGFYVLPGVLVILLGHVGGYSAGPLSASVLSMIVGTLLYLLGLHYGRKVD